MSLEHRSIQYRIVQIWCQFFVSSDHDWRKPLDESIYGSHHWVNRCSKQNEWLLLLLIKHNICAHLKVWSRLWALCTPFSATLPIFLFVSVLLYVNRFFLLFLLRAFFDSIFKRKGIQQYLWEKDEKNQTEPIFLFWMSKLCGKHGISEWFFTKHKTRDIRLFEHLKLIQNSMQRDREEWKKKKMVQVQSKEKCHH